MAAQTQPNKELEELLKICRPILVAGGLCSHIRDCLIAPALSDPELLQTRAPSLSLQAIGKICKKQKIRDGMICSLISQLNTELNSSSQSILEILLTAENLERVCAGEMQGKGNRLTRLPCPWCSPSAIIHWPNLDTHTLPPEKEWIPLLINGETARELLFERLDILQLAQAQVWQYATSRGDMDLANRKREVADELMPNPRFVEYFWSGATLAWLQIYLLGPLLESVATGRPVCEQDIWRLARDKTKKGGATFSGRFGSIVVRLLEGKYGHRRKRTLAPPTPPDRQTCGRLSRNFLDELHDAAARLDLPNSQALALRELITAHGTIEDVDWTDASKELIEKVSRIHNMGHKTLRNLFVSAMQEHLRRQGEFT